MGGWGLVCVAAGQAKGSDGEWGRREGVRGGGAFRVLTDICDVRMVVDVPGRWKGRDVAGGGRVLERVGVL